MAKPLPTNERPTIPWGGMILVALAIFGAIALVQFVLGTLLGLIKLAIVVVVAIALIGVFVGRKGDR
ncbi:MAG: hypothetical protein L0221_19345 [Chloroflexi bacterium]|nr:hypothetical protein [Chloroflexota bacterium]